MTERPEFNGWQHAKQAASLLRSNFDPALRACGLWLGLLVFLLAVTAPGAAWLARNSADFVAFVQSFEDPTLVQLILVLPFVALMAVAWPSVAVAWHRFVLRQEQPTILPFSPLRGGAYLLLTAVFISVSWILPGAFLSFAFLTMKEPNDIVVLICIALFAGLLGLTMRFSLKLPAIALSDHRMTLARSWKETETMWPGMLWGTVVLTVPLYFVTKGVDLLANKLADAGQLEISVLLSAVNLTAIFVGVLLYATFLSFCYRHAVGEID